MVADYISAILNLMTSNQKNMNSFYQILVNTFVANITTSFLWFALTFWVYLETKSVLATGIIGGSYMLLVAFCSIWFCTLVDHHKKHTIMLFAAASTTRRISTRRYILYAGVKRHAT